MDKYYFIQITHEYHLIITVLRCRIHFGSPGVMPPGEKFMYPKKDYGILKK